MRVEPSKPRFTIEPSGTGVTVRTPAQRNWLVMLFLVVWLGMWTLGGGTTVSQVLGPGHQKGFLSLWLVGWLFGELYVISIILWQLAGREELTFSGGNLVHRVAIGSLGRSREFSGASLKHLRTSPQLGSPWMDQGRWMPPLFGSGYGSISFDYGARTYRVGAGLDEAEARLVLAEIQKRFPKMVESGT